MLQVLLSLFCSCLVFAQHAPLEQAWDLLAKGQHREAVHLLYEIIKANPGVAIGSHPFFDPQHGPNTSLVLRASDPQKLQRARRAVEDMLQRVQGAQSSSA